MTCKNKIYFQTDAANNGTNPNTPVYLKFKQRRLLRDLAKDLDDYNRLSMLHLRRIENPQSQLCKFDSFRLRKICDLKLKIENQIEQLDKDCLINSAFDLDLLKKSHARFLKAVEVSNKVSEAYQQRFLREKIREANVPNGINAFQKL